MPVAHPEPPDAVDPGVLLTRRFKEIEGKTKAQHTRGVEQCAKAHGAVARLRRNAVETKTRFCFKHPKNGGGNGQDVDGLVEDPDEVSEEDAG